MDYFFIHRDEDFNLLTPENVSMFKHAYDGYVYDLEQAILAGGNVNLISEGGYTPLMLASKKGHYNCVDALLKYGADVNTMTKNSKTVRTALLESSNQPEIFEALVNHGADIKVLNEFKQTPLIIACDQVWVKEGVVNAVIDEEIINQQDARGYTAIMRLAFRDPNNIGLMKELVKVGADIGIKNNNGNTVIDILEQHENRHTNRKIEETIGWLEDIALQKLIISDCQNQGMEF